MTRSPNESYIDCWKCQAAGLGGGDYLREVARTIGCTAPELKANPLKYLAEYLDQPGPSSAVPREQITQAHVDGWGSRLWSDDRALAWLRARGLTDETIREYRLGYDGDKDAIVIPVYESGEPVRVKRRYLDPAADPKTVNSGGKSKLYPDVPERGGILFVAGELDALIGRQMGLPTVSTTCGAKLPAHLASAFAGRRVFVMFDVGENLAAVKAHQRLLAYGAESAGILLLEKLGLRQGGDLNDLYLRGGTADDVKALARRGMRVA